MADGRASEAEAWVFHAGALGDFVMTWPLIRALAHRFGRVHVVADSEKAGLASRWIGARGEVVARDVQGRAFTRLWSGAEAAPSDVAAGASLVVNFVADPGTEPGGTWERAARSMFPLARIEWVGPPGSGSRVHAWGEFGMQQWGGVAERKNRDGAVVAHVGAGGGAKRWPLERWNDLRELLVASGMSVELIAGEVEAEKLTPMEHSSFRSAGGKICRSLEELARLTSTAFLFVGADTGPTHLAAQLGVPTLALFGPTDAKIWAPVGPRVRVLAAPAAAGMEWHTPARVAAEVRSMSPE